MPIEAPRKLPLACLYPNKKSPCRRPGSAESQAFRLTYVVGRLFERQML